MLTASRRQRRHREVGSEGSPRQSSDPRNTNRIRGWAARMSRPSTVKSATTKGLSGRCGGARAKAAVLIRGDLTGCRRLSASDRRRRKVAPDRSGVSSGHSTGGDQHRREGPNVSPRVGRGQTRDRRIDRSHSISVMGLPLRREGEALRDAAAERSADPASPEPSPHPARADDLWEDFLSRENLARALRRVEVNRGAPGPDGMGTAELRPHLKSAWPALRASLDAGTYRPGPVRRVTIPKPGGGERELGVPTVTDRFLQQALSQVLSPIFEPHLLRPKLRLSTRTERPPGGGSRKAGNRSQDRPGSSMSIWTGSSTGFSTMP